ncbi:hypothetical protein SAMN06295879_2094 [Agreia bicolorata]|uniref:GAF domain-containing protein n=1 Tax=Agreia bicolorata TaxID=110935 RepID=A0A1T4Y234_9MICO|nr:hypothetical protein SAMN06295879_2094 [Agreia bicolorata]
MGSTLLWLRQKFILSIIILLGATVAVFAPLVLTDAAWTPYRIGAGILAALAVFGDRYADNYEKKVALGTFRESERSAEKSISDLNILLSEAIEATFLQGAARVEAIKALRRTVSRLAASSIGPGTRASYYPLRRVAGGTRILDRPFHTTEPGRNDKPDRPFIETEDPKHDVWTIMDRDDEEPEVKKAYDEVSSVDWDKKKYKTFYSVPVKANMVQFGFLSVSHAKVGSIGGPQQAAILAMARTVALTIAAEKGPTFMKKQAAYYRVSGVPANVSITKEEGES